MSTNARVVFIHGFMGSALNWGRIRMLLEAKGAKAFAVDMLGHANRHPKRPFVGTAHEALANDLIHQLEDIKPTHVVSHSFGFRPSLLMAQKRADLIPHLIVEDASPMITPQAHSYLMSILNAPVPFRTREDAKLYFDNTYGAQTALSRFFLSNIRSREDGLADWRFDKAFLEELLNEALAQNLWKEWEDFPNQTSLVFGTNSETMPPSIVNEMKSHRKELKTYPIEDAGHWIHSDQPEAFVETIASIVGV